MGTPFPISGQERPAGQLTSGQRSVGSGEQVMCPSGEEGSRQRGQPPLSLLFVHPSPLFHTPILLRTSPKPQLWERPRMGTWALGPDSPNFPTSCRTKGLIPYDHILDSVKQGTLGSEGKKG